MDQYMMARANLSSHRQLKSITPGLPLNVEYDSFTLLIIQNEPTDLNLNYHVNEYYSCQDRKQFPIQRCKSASYLRKANG